MQKERWRQVKGNSGKRERASKGRESRGSAAATLYLGDFGESGEEKSASI